MEDLRAAIAGQVFVPGDAGYDQARMAWNLAVDERPAVVVSAESAADVVQAVRFARSRGMRIAPQGTGHGASPRLRQPTTPTRSSSPATPSGRPGPVLGRTDP
jgi:FAD binding domain